MDTKPNVLDELQDQLPIDDRLGFSIFVRNEMHTLPELIDTIKDYVDEIVVVDTGSTDGTYKYLRAQERTLFPKLRPYLINVPMTTEHFHFGYIRSMAAHLNNCGHVLMLDADERIDTTGLARIRDYWHPKMIKHKWLTMGFPRRNWEDGPRERKKYNEEAYPDWQVRMIRNDGMTWWRRPVHEGVLFGAQGLDINHIGCSDVHIEHFHNHFKKQHDLNINRTEFYAELALSDPEWLNSFPPEVITDTAVKKKTIQLAYKRFLGRVPTDVEIQTWSEAELTETEIYKTIGASEEAKNRTKEQ